jgi:nicotinate-nucleotide adenylyltransferase
MAKAPGKRLLETLYYFGTFSPIHVLHVSLAYRALQVGGFARLQWVPTGDPPHRQARKASLLSASLRERCLQWVCDREERFSLCRLELQRPGPHFTIDTLTLLEPDLLARENPLPSDSRIPLLVGQDAFESLESWKEAKHLAQCVHWLVACRSVTPEVISEVSPEVIEKRPLIPPALNGLSYEVLPLEPSPLSATWLRQRLRDGRLIQPWLPFPASFLD